MTALQTLRFLLAKKRIDTASARKRFLAWCGAEDEETEELMWQDALEQWRAGNRRTLACILPKAIRVALDGLVTLDTKITLAERELLNQEAS